MRNISFGLVRLKITIFLFITFIFSLLVTAVGTISASVNPQVSAGGFHSLALKPDGSVWAWGRNDFGQLGNGTTGNSSIPVQTSNLNDVIAINCGWFYSAALKSDGTVWTWGRNDFGQLGNGTTSNSTAPVQVNNLSGVVAIAGGGFHCLALKSDGTVWAWGRNDFGQLGNGTTTTNSTAPVQVNNLSGVIAIAGGGFHCLALKSNGTVLAWGRNDFGQLGNGTTSNSSAPVSVKNLNGVVTIAGGGFHCLALKSNGTVLTWGRNDSGQLGNGTTNNSTTPVQVKNLNGIAAIDRGRFHSLAMKSNGTVWGWGDNADGQLGNGTISNSTIPVQVKNLNDVVTVAGGGHHSLALKSEGSAWAWGQNDFGQLGDGTTHDSTVPVQIFIDLSNKAGNVTGRVTDAQTGTGINGVTMTLNTGGTATTSTIRGVNGVYAIPNVPVGQHEITASALNYASSSQTITVEEGNPDKTGKNVFNFQLTPLPGTPTPTPTPGAGNVAGRVTDAQTGTGINDVTMTLNTGGTATTSTVRGVDGVYAIPNVPVGQHEITASALNYASSSQTITVEEGNPDKTGKNVFNFQLTPLPGTPTPTPTPTPGTGNVTGQVTDAQTEAGINGATITLNTGETATTSTVRGVDGVYAIPNVSVGQHEITASAVNYTASSQTITVEEGNPDKTGKNVFTFKLAPITATPTPTPTPIPGTTGTIAGQVKDSVTGAPITDAKVVVVGTGKESTTLTNGVYQITGVAVGQQIIEASKEGYETASQNAVVEQGNPVPQTGKNVFNFQLVPISATPSPTPLPTPICVADSMEASPKTMQLTGGESGEETITVVCKDGSPVAGEAITWKIKPGKKRITIVPKSAITDANGEAKFTITATKQAGNAKIKFRDTRANLKTTVTVEVIE